MTTSDQTQDSGPTSEAGGGSYQPLFRGDLGHDVYTLLQRHGERPVLRALRSWLELLEGDYRPGACDLHLVLQGAECCALCGRYAEEIMQMPGERGEAEEIAPAGTAALAAALNGTSRPTSPGGGSSTSSEASPETSPLTSDPPTSDTSAGSRLGLLGERLESLILGSRGAGLCAVAWRPAVVSGEPSVLCHLLTSEDDGGWFSIPLSNGFGEKRSSSAGSGATP